MAAGSPGRSTLEPKKKVKVEVETQKLVLIIVDIYASEDEKIKELGGHLAGCIIEAYDDTQEMTSDILGTYVSKMKLVAGMRSNMKKIYPEASKILSEIFGIFLFGEKL
jgi:hypothetical protein